MFLTKGRKNGTRDGKKEEDGGEGNVSESKECFIVPDEEEETFEKLIVDVDK